MTAQFDGQFQSARFCEACCLVMAAYVGVGTDEAEDAYEARIQLGLERRAAAAGVA